MDRYNTSKHSFKSTGLLSNTVVRCGLTEHFEISSLVEYKSEHDVYGYSYGFSAVDVGMRYNIYMGEGLIPDIGFQIRWRIPKVGGSYEVNHWAPRFLVVTGQKISDAITLITNLGVSWNGENGIPQANYTANLSYVITDRVGIFIESFGSVFQANLDTWVDGGLAFLINKDLQLDISTGFGNNDAKRDYFVSTGVSWRTKRKPNR